MGLLDDKDEFRWSDAAAGFSRTVGIEPLGAPVDIINSGLNALGVYKALGLQVPTKPFGGSQSISDFYKYLGYQDNPGSRGDEIGAAVGMFAPIAGLFSGLKAPTAIEKVKDAFDSRSNLSFMDLYRIKRGLLDVENGKTNEFIRLNKPLTKEQYDSLQKQRADINALLAKRNYFSLDANHIYESRVIRDGYSIADVMKQIKSATSRKSTVEVDVRRKQNNLVSPRKRDDGYGNMVQDRIGIDLRGQGVYRTVIPKGDNIKPKK